MNYKIIFLVAVLFCLVSSCSYEPTYMQFELDKLNAKNSDTLEMGFEDLVSKIEILKVGNINGEAIIEFDNGAGRYVRYELSGVVDTMHATEWYSTKCHFIYNPKGLIDGDSLILKYRMF